MPLQHRRTIVLLLLAVLLLSPFPAMGGTYSASSTLDTYVAVADNSQTTFSIVPYGGTTTTGNVTAALLEADPMGAYDGHFVLFDDPPLQTEVFQFLGTAATGTPTIE